ncbi:MAG: DUF4339 domain-containing protein [Verrucomicrobia bacterium]|nr:DUF4339 domain-containing protein [Verrucomicrobiota bacterium]
MTEGIFYLKLAGKVEGPYTIGQIYDLWAARKINSQTMFARLEAMDKWLPLAELTLTVSPPRPTIPKPAPPEAAPVVPARPRTAPSLRPEDYLPSIPTKTERPPRPARQPSSAISTRIGKVLLGLELHIGICLAGGVLLALYFLFFLPASTDGIEVNQERLFLKQNGVLAGIGLVLLGGLLIVARQIQQISAAPKADTASKSERKLPQP